MSADVLNVLVAGGSGASGIAVARALRGAGHAVFTVGSDAARIAAAAAAAGEGVVPLTCDLADPAAVAALRADLAGRGVRLDGVIHLVGGWRGAKGIADQPDEDWDFLERNAVTTLRNVSRAFYDDLTASGTGRLAMVSSTTAAARPPARQLRRGQAPPPKPGPWPWPTASAASSPATRNTRWNNTAPRRSSWSRRWLTTPCAPRRRSGNSGYTNVADLAAAVVRLFDTPAGELNGRRLPLSR